MLHVVTFWSENNQHVDIGSQFSAEFRLSIQVVLSAQVCRNHWVPKKNDQDVFGASGCLKAETSSMRPSGIPWLRLFTRWVVLGEPWETQVASPRESEATKQPRSLSSWDLRWSKHQKGEEIEETLSSYSGCHLIWLVVWNIFYFSIYWVSNHPNWLSYFSEGWPNHQPATGWCSQGKLSWWRAKSFLAETIMASQRPMDWPTKRLADGLGFFWLENTLYVFVHVFVHVMLFPTKFPTSQLFQLQLFNDFLPMFISLRLGIHPDWPTEPGWELDFAARWWTAGRSPRGAGEGT